MKRTAENRSKRREPLRRAFVQVVDALAEEKSRLWMSQHPPRLETPVSLGSWRSPDQDHYESTYDVEFGPTPRPESPVWRVPIMAAPSLRFREARAYDAGDAYRTFDMRAVQWGVSFGTTRLRWWNWEPVEPENDSEVAAYKAASGAFNLMLRLTPHIEQLVHLDPWSRSFPWSESGERFPLPGDVALRYWRESLDLLETWLGLVKTRYVVPGWRGLPEDRTTEARRA